jgi:hypothetical protein
MVALKKPRPYRPENSKISLMNRRHCPKEEPMLAVNKPSLSSTKYVGGHQKVVCLFSRSIYRTQDT